MITTAFDEFITTEYRSEWQVKLYLKDDEIGWNLCKDDVKLISSTLKYVVELCEKLLEKYFDVEFIEIIDCSFLINKQSIIMERKKGITIKNRLL